MIVYLDTSALVKLYIDEAGSDDIRQMCEEAEAVATHRIAYAEARAAFARLAREERLNAPGHTEVKNRIDADWSHFAVVEAGDRLVRRAGDLAEAFALRGFDSVHLAAAEHVRNEVGVTVGFACFDHRLVRAAGVLGLEPVA